MKYSDFIEVNESFQTSINLEYDLNKLDKVNSYIPTEQSVRIIGSFLRTYYFNNESQNRATVLIGPYGRGKSHLLLVLTALTSMDVFGSYDYTVKQAKETQEELCRKIANIDEKVGALAKAVNESGIRALPIIINSNTTDINQAFLAAVKNALERAGLEDLLPKTYFDAAIEILDRWLSDYPDVVSQLSIELKKEKKSIESLYLGLKQFNQEAYYDFCNIYPLVAAGTHFNPLSNMDVVKLYTAVVNALCEQTKYTGINIIFDEFSKFLESNLDASKMLNFKIIQDMAEAATRSGKEQIHFTCITHKDILDYSSSDSFKTVEGRFNKIRYVASSEQSYELISNAIPKKESFDAFQVENKGAFDRVSQVVSIVNVFEELSPESFEKKVLKGCFPLAPLTSFSLLHISELVGQNERTLFTFLAKKDAYSLPEFLCKDYLSAEFVTVDTIYDYFQGLLKKEVFNAAVHSVWAKTDTALRQISNDDQRKILKAIAIIYMIKDERFRAIPAHIKAALLMEDETFSKASLALQKTHVLSQRDSSEYVLLTANGVDVQKNVENYVNSKITRISCGELLESRFSMGYVIPREYNDRYSMLRYFKRVFMDATVLLNYMSGEQLLHDYPADGLIIYVLSDNDDIKAIIDHISTYYDTPEIIVCISFYKYDFEDQLKRILAIQQLMKTNLANDPHYLEEIEYFEEDIAKQIRSAIDEAYAPTSKYSKYYNSRGQLEVYRQADLNQIVTRICLERYSKTPVINNEMVNKKTLNSQNLKGRNLAVDWVLQWSQDTEIPCMSGYGPEVSIFKSMYVHTGLDKSEKVQDPGICEVLSLIGEFVDSSEYERKSFREIYRVLESSPYGMRKGIIPLFMAYVLRKYRDVLAIYFKGREIELNASVLSAINDNSDDYTLQVEPGTIEREEYLSTLEELFREHVDLGYAGTNRIFAIVKSMQTWMRSLPEYTKKFTQFYHNGTLIRVDNSTKLIRNDLLKFDINAREMLFESWKERLSANGEYTECAAEIKRVKELLDMHIVDFRESLRAYLIAMFMPGYTGTLSKAMKLWYEKLPDSTKQHVFDTETNALLVLAEKWNSYDDQRLLNDMSMLFVSMAIEDWTDQLSDQFKKILESTLERVNTFVEVKNEKSECKLSIVLPEAKIERSFSDAEISPLGRTALSNLRAVLDEYNYAIEPDEQLAIIAKLIRDVIK